MKRGDTGRKKRGIGKFILKTAIGLAIGGLIGRSVGVIGNILKPIGKVKNFLGIPTPFLNSPIMKYPVLTGAAVGGARSAIKYSPRNQYLNEYPSYGNIYQTPPDSSPRKSRNSNLETGVEEEFNSIIVIGIMGVIFSMILFVFNALNITGLIISQGELSLPISLAMIIFIASLGIIILGKLKNKLKK